MIYNIGTFISDCRTDRKREIYELRLHNINVKPERDYKLIDKIVFNNSDADLVFAFDSDYREIRFYIIDNDSHVYLSILDIVLLLFKMAEVEGKKIIINLLKNQLHNYESCPIPDNNSTSDEEDEICINNHFESFTYRGIEYYIRATNCSGLESCVERCVSLDNASMSIGYEKLLYLINIIQEKSSMLFSWKSKKSLYINGFVRLLIALLETDAKHKILKDKCGWEYNSVLNAPSLIDSGKDRKYYLTEAEYYCIIGGEES